MKPLQRAALALGLVFLPLAALSAQSGASASPDLLPPAGPEGPGPWLQLVPHYETGLLFVASHQYQSGKAGEASTGELFDYVAQGGQDVLFPYQRLSVDVHLGQSNLVTLLYQPLTLTTKSVAGRNGTGDASGAVVVDGVTFAKGTVLDLVYGFDFWRASWLYNWAQGRGEILGVGASLQLRNASIAFTSADGTQRTVSDNIGPVPILKARWAHWFGADYGLDLSADGIYVASAFFNGATKDFAGWLWDVSLSAKTRFVPGSTAFLTVRSLGGGAQGNNAYDTKTATNSSSGAYSYNALSTVAVTLGVELGELGPVRP